MYKTLFITQFTAHELPKNSHSDNYISCKVVKDLLLETISVTHIYAISWICAIIIIKFLLNRPLKLSLLNWEKLYDLYIGTM